MANNKNTVQLTFRQQEVAKLLCERLKYKNIAEKLNITTATVKIHARDIYARLGLTGKVGSKTARQELIELFKYE